MEKVWLGIAKDYVHQGSYGEPHEYVMYCEVGDIPFEDFLETTRFIGEFELLNEIHCDEHNISILWLRKNGEYYILVADEVTSELYELCKF